MTLLSIIIPISAFDERHARCHELILSAIRNKCEVILVVDAETPDAQQSIARNFSDINDVNFRIVSGYFNNPGAARNFGLTKASYEWITFWDSDDFAHVDSIIQDIVEHGSDYDVLIGRYITHNVGSNSKYRKPSVPNLKLENNLNTFARNLGLWRIVFRAQRIEGIRFPSISMAEDKVYFASLSLDQSEIFFSRKSYYEYSVGNSQSLTKSKKTIDDLRKAINILENLYPAGISRNDFVKRLLRQLSLTSIKYGSLKLKLYGIRTLLLTMKDN